MLDKQQIKASLKTTCRTHESKGRFALPECSERATYWVMYKSWPTPVCTEHLEEWESEAQVDHKWKIPSEA
jgi:hypothetical protein